MFAYKFTVFTPTYNRGHLLGDLYNSLKEQTYKDFQWIIVDDGSRDNTKDIVKEYIKEGVIDIDYTYKENEGKHIAFNLGVERAKGELFLLIDSDDYLKKDTLEIFKDEWDKISNKGEFSSICGLCENKKGELVGSKFPKDVIDSNSREIREIYGVLGDKGAFTKTSIYREYPFPVYKGEKFITEAVVDDLISLKYKTRFINKILFVKEYQVGGLSDNSLKIRVESSNGTLHYYNQGIAIAKTFKKKIRHGINYNRFLLHSGKNIVEGIKKCSNPFISLVTFIFSYAMYLNDKKKLK